MRGSSDLCPVAELGPLNETAHKVDECVAVADLGTLTRIYRALSPAHVCVIAEAGRYLRDGRETRVRGCPLRAVARTDYAAAILKLNLNGAFMSVQPRCSILHLVRSL